MKSHDNSPFNEDQLKQLSAKLDDSAIAQREGPGGKMLDYIEGWRAIDTANKIFGFGQWGIRNIDLRQVFHLEEGNKHHIGYLCTVELVVSGENEQCIPTSDTGYGSGNFASLSDAIELATKEAVTDAMKRAFRHYGDQFGNGLYDSKKEDHIAVDLDGLRGRIMELRVLPELQGSDKQLWAANTVRNALMTKAIAHFRGLDGFAAKIESSPDDPKLLGFAALCLETRAKFWLDNVEKSGAKWDTVTPESLTHLVSLKMAELGFDAEPEREPGDESEVKAEDIDF